MEIGKHPFALFLNNYYERGDCDGGHRQSREDSLQNYSPASCVLQMMLNAFILAVDGFIG
jgi:hypothetical protein